MAYIFGYGSLVDINELKSYLDDEDVEYEYLTIEGLKRDWSVAMNNSINLPKYKYYKDNEGVRVDKFIAYLNVKFEGSSSVNGVLFKVDGKKIKHLDFRERNYNRVNITRLVPNNYDGETVWTYMGKQESRERFLKGYNENKVVIHKEYLDKVLEAFKSVSYHYFIEFIKQTDFTNIPIVSLNRINL